MRNRHFIDCRAASKPTLDLSTADAIFERLIPQSFSGFEYCWSFSEVRQTRCIDLPRHVGSSARRR
jgi:hypothetical protein